MKNEELLNRLFFKMTDYFKNDKKRIFHFIKVNSLAAHIGEAEKIDEHTLFILKAAAYVHDIGIKPSEEKYGSCTGKQQELEGPPAAEKMLSELNFDKSDVERIKYLVAHHHTYAGIDGADYQILVEADLIVNMEEDKLGSDAIKICLDKYFKTKTGIAICKNIFGV